MSEPDRVEIWLKMQKMLEKPKNLIADLNSRLDEIELKTNKEINELKAKIIKYSGENARLSNFFAEIRETLAGVLKDVKEIKEKIN